MNVSILEEDIVEPDQVFQIYLASYDPVILTPNSSASVTILDNDGESIPMGCHALILHTRVITIKANPACTFKHVYTSPI